MPIIVFLLSKDKEVRDHSKKALISHLIPFVSAIFAFILLFGSFFTNNEFAIGGTFFFGFILVIIVNVAVVIYNIYKAIKLYV